MDWKFRQLQVELRLGASHELVVCLDVVPLGLGVEFHRSGNGEAPLECQRLEPAARLHHVGVGVNLLLVPLGKPWASPIGGPIAHGNVATGVHGLVGGPVQLHAASPVTSEGRQVLAGPGELLRPLVLRRHGLCPVRTNRCPRET